MEMKISGGDYLPDGAGGFLRVTGAEELLQRALLKLSARRGGFAPMPEFGSRLHLLGAEKPSGRLAAARLYAAEALSDEPELSISGVELREGDEGLFEMTIRLECEGGEHTLEFTI